MDIDLGPAITIRESDVHAAAQFSGHPPFFCFTERSGRCGAKTNRQLSHTSRTGLGEHKASWEQGYPQTTLVVEYS